MLEQCKTKLRTFFKKDRGSKKKKDYKFRKDGDRFDRDKIICPIVKNN